ncbi:hypothetical protein [Geomicrobium sp. JCM 19039]|uniref:hypothetical protein n=1 Tax=Geomicrobium sp. JCM 19039 TaxID=1460636 RepID=UPI001267E119|nr:hypothetical protein [Geomicrobium sp. JCM 19039]
MNKFTVRCLVPFAISAVVLSGCITDEDAMTTDPDDDGLGDANTNEENSEGEDSSDGGTLTLRKEPIWFRLTYMTTAIQARRLSMSTSLVIL